MGFLCEQPAQAVPKKKNLVAQRFVTRGRSFVHIYTYINDDYKAPRGRFIIHKEKEAKRTHLYLHAYIATYSQTPTDRPTT